MDYDVFISHASEDKSEVARPLAHLLRKAGLRVWLDEFELTVGDSLRRAIDEGLRNSRFYVVILSRSSLSKEWPQKELDALIARDDGGKKIILPVWHNLSKAEVSSLVPLLSDRLAVSTNKGVDFVAKQLLKAIRKPQDATRIQELNQSTKLRPWRVLELPDCRIRDEVLDTWESLIGAQETSKQDCLHFLRDHAGLFFLEPSPEVKLFAISELRLGIDVRVNFCVVEEGFTPGTQYTLITVGTPNSSLYRNTNGKQSAKLSDALDQIMECQRWINANRNQAERLFPSKGWARMGEPVIQYRIVAGRRSENERFLEKIRSVERTTGVEITSFDRLTDTCRRRSFPSFLNPNTSGQTLKYKEELYTLNDAVNPFFMSISDSMWRKISEEHYMGKHILVPFLEKIVAQLEVNQDLLAKFDHYVESLNPEDRELWLNFDKVKL